MAITDVVSLSVLYVDLIYLGWVGGVAASLKHNNMEITDNWLYHIKVHN